MYGLEDGGCVFTNLKWIHVWANKTMKNFLWSWTLIKVSVFVSWITKVTFIKRKAWRCFNYHIESCQPFMELKASEVHRRNPGGNHSMSFPRKWQWRMITHPRKTLCSGFVSLQICRQKIVNVSNILLQFCVDIALVT